MIKTFFEILLNLDQYLNFFVQNFGIWTYLVIFAVIFAETGLVIIPFLPGDSLLFALGTLAAKEILNIWWLIILLSAASILGDSINYTIGKYFSDKIINKTFGRFVKKEYLDKTHSFYEKYGGKTIIIARFVPIVRTFAPFVAGIGKMSYSKFIAYNVSGGILWVSSIISAGYFFGNIPVIKNNFTIVVLTIIFISVLPGIIEFLKFKLSKKTSASQNV